MDPIVKLNSSEKDLLQDPTAYRRLVRKLMYLTISRPDITFVVHKLSQFMTKPNKTHMDASNHLLGNIKGSLGQGIFLSKTHDLSKKPLQMQIGDHVLTSVAQLLDFVSSLVNLQYHGSQRNIKQFLNHRLKQSIELWPQFPVRLYGLKVSSKNFKLKQIHQPLFMVIIRLSFT